MPEDGLIGALWAGPGSRMGASWRAPLRVLCAAALASVLAWAYGTARADTWTITLVEGDASVLEGTQRQVAKPGLRLGPAAIVETNARLGLLRLENGEQVSIDLGPDSKAMLSPPGPLQRGKPPQLYLLQGWAKLTSHGAAALPGAATAGLALAPAKGALVLHATRRDQAVFAESGRLELTERRTGGATHSLDGGRMLLLDGSRRGTVLQRPEPGWLAKVPRAFRDAIPLRLAAVKDRRVDATALPGADYAMLADWLGAEPDIRRSFPQRFGALAREPEFRRQVQAHMTAHPEWNPVINPPPPPPRTP